MSFRTFIDVIRTFKAVIGTRKPLPKSRAVGHWPRFRLGRQPWPAGVRPVAEESILYRNPEMLRMGWTGVGCARMTCIQWIGMPARVVAQVSGHSTRVGAAQDLAALDIDLAAITQAGGWKSPRMPLQYAEKISAARSGMARAAEKLGRDSSGQPRGAPAATVGTRAPRIQSIHPGLLLYYGKGRL